MRREFDRISAQYEFQSAMFMLAVEAAFEPNDELVWKYW